MDAVKKEIWICAKCNKFFNTERAADKCCKQTFCECGKKKERYYFRCRACISSLAYEKAVKIKYSDYRVDMFYDDNNGRFYSDRDEQKDCYENEGCIDDLPAYAYGCCVIDFKVDADHALENARDYMHEDFDDDEIVDEPEFYQFIKEWNDKQTGKTFCQDNSTVVLFEEEL